MTQRTYFPYVLFAAAVVAVLFLVSYSNYTAHASAPSGLTAVIATTSQITVGATISGAPILATSTCTARIVSTGPRAVSLTMSDKTGQVPSGIFGYYQAASTTVAYDSGLYGCGALRAFGAGADSVITVSESI